MDDQERDLVTRNGWSLIADCAGAPALARVNAAPLLVARSAGCTLIEAAGRVVDALQAVSGLELFELRENGPARPWPGTRPISLGNSTRFNGVGRAKRPVVAYLGPPDNDRQMARMVATWRAQPSATPNPETRPDAKPGPELVAETLERLRQHWADLAVRGRSLDARRSGAPQLFANLAIRRSVFFDLFERVQESRASADARIVPLAASVPDAGAAASQSWPESQRVAMNALRKTMSDTAIGQKYGISRQRVGQLLGPRPKESSVRRRA